MFTKSASLVLLLTFLGTASFAQPAADFTITNTENNVVSLYSDYLNQGTTVVLDIFFTTCPPCQTAAPLIEPLYQEWGGGDYDVEFIALSIQGFDSNADVLDYANNYGHTYPGAGQDGGALTALTAYTNGTYGNFLGTPTFVVIAPDGSVTYDVRGPGPGYQNTMDELDAAIAATGAQKPGGIVYNYGGSILSENHPVDDVYIKITDCSNPADTVEPEFETYTAGGTFTFALPDPANNNSCLYPEKLDGLLDGVSTIDIIFIRRHMLDIAHLDPDILMYKADINNDDRVSTIDIVHLRRAILALTNEFPNNTSWRFDSEISFQIDPNSEGPYNFEAYKVGDVNGNLFDENDFRNNIHWKLNVSNGLAKKMVTIHPGENIQTSGFQFCLSGIPQDAQIRTPLPDFNDSNFNIADNQLLVSYDSPFSVSLYENQALFEITVPASSHDEVQLNRETLSPEFYAVDGYLQTLEISTVAQHKTIVYPNPAYNHVGISYFIKKNGEVNIELLDATGKILFSLSEYGLAGNHQQRISTEKLKAGVYYLRLIAAEINETHPLVILR